MYLFERTSEKKKNIREKKRSFFHLLVHFADDCNSQGRTTPEPGARNPEPILVLNWTAGVSVPSAPAFFPRSKWDLHSA